MATWSNWIKSANDKKVLFPLLINQPRDLERLHSSGLPYCQYIIISGKEYSLNNLQIKGFFQKYPQIWVRIVNPKTKERYVKLGITSIEELNQFILGLNVNLEEFLIQLYEFRENKFGGNVISGESGVFIELLKGSQDQIERSTNLFFHGRLDYSGKLTFFELDVPIEIKDAAGIVLNYLRLGRNEYLNGYFEFAVLDNNEVFFFDYKPEFDYIKK